MQYLIIWDTILPMIVSFPSFIVTWFWAFGRTLLHNTILYLVFVNHCIKYITKTFGMLRCQIFPLDMWRFIAPFFGPLKAQALLFIRMTIWWCSFRLGGLWRTCMRIMPLLNSLLVGSTYYIWIKVVFIHSAKNCSQNLQYPSQEVIDLNGCKQGKVDNSWSLSIVK